MTPQMLQITVFMACTMPAISPEKQAGLAALG
jgi:hypothetical protein